MAKGLRIALDKIGNRFEVAMMPTP